MTNRLKTLNDAFASFICAYQYMIMYIQYENEFPDCAKPPDEDTKKKMMSEMASVLYYINNKKYIPQIPVYKLYLIRKSYMSSMRIHFCNGSTFLYKEKILDLGKNDFGYPAMYQLLKDIRNTNDAHYIAEEGLGNKDKFPDERLALHSNIQPYLNKIIKYIKNLIDDENSKQQN